MLISIIGECQSIIIITGIKIIENQMTSFIIRIIINIEILIRLEKDRQMKTEQRYNSKSNNTPSVL